MTVLQHSDTPAFSRGHKAATPHTAPAWQPPRAASSSTRGQDVPLSARPVRVIQQGQTCPGTSTHSHGSTMRIKMPVLMITTHRKPSVPPKQRGTHSCSASSVEARMPQQKQLHHQLLTVFSGLPSQIPPSYFKEDPAHTENTALRKVQELKQTLQKKNGCWVSKDRSVTYCQAPIRVGILILQSATKCI